MKMTLALILVMAASLAYAAPDTTITTYYTGYKLVASTNSASGTTGLAISTAYACFPVSVLTYCTEAEASHTNAATDVRALIFSINKVLNDAVDALASTNKFAYFLLSDGIAKGTDTDTIMSIRTQTAIDLGTTTLPSE